MSATSLGVLALPLIFTGDTDKERLREIRAEEKRVYLYKNMLSFNDLGLAPMIGQGRVLLGVRLYDIKPLNMDDNISFMSTSGVSVTMGVGSNIPENVINALPGTYLFRINITSLIPLSLKPTLMDPVTKYSRITPLINMTGTEFNTKIQMTAPLWKPIRKN